MCTNKSTEGASVKGSVDLGGQWHWCPWWAESRSSFEVTANPFNANYMPHLLFSLYNATLDASNWHGLSTPVTSLPY